MILDLNIFIIVAIVPTGCNPVQMCCKCTFQGVGGTPWLQPKINVTVKQGSLKILKFLDADFRFKCFHYSGHYAHRVANLCKSAANALFRGWGDTFLAAQKKLNFQISLNFFFELHFAGSWFKHFIMVATVLIGLQTCAKVQQMHPSGGGGTPCLQPKINVTFK